MMASSSSSKLFPPSFSTSPNPFPAITKAECYAFHSIDRTIFSRLVLELERNNSQSLRVMSLWIWLERTSLSPTVYTISKFPNPKLLALFDEAVFCLKLVQGELSIGNLGQAEFPLLKSVARKTDICPKFFIDNRVIILSGMEKAFQDVCIKAFDDIIEKSSLKKKFKSSDVCQVENVSKTIFFRDMVDTTGLSLPVVVSDVSKIAEVNMPMPVGSLYTESTIVHGTLPFPGSINLMQQYPFEGEVTEMLRLMRLGNRKDEEEIFLDERTIFLTFSKGYPIPEKEVKDFFTRLFGDIVEQVCMQDVLKDEQPLYARLVLRDPCTICTILEGQNKAKFSINGKHIWARKYVHKTTKSATTTSDIASITSPLT